MGDGERRFFANDVLARFDRRNRHRRVPVVGRGDHHGIDVVAGDHLAPIPGHLAGEVVAETPPRGLQPCLDAPRVDVAQGNRLGVLLAQKHLQVPPDAVAAKADESHSDPVAGGNRAAGAQSG